MLSPVARARRSMERELSLMLRRPTPTGSLRKCERDLHSEIMAEPAITRRARRPHAPGVSGHMY